MRPFKFFFALSLGVIFFLFLARFLVFALIAAGFLSLLFFVGRKIKNFFHRLDWEEHDIRAPYRLKQRKPVWKDGLLLEYPEPEPDYIDEFRKIKVQ